MKIPSKIFGLLLLLCFMSVVTAPQNRKPKSPNKPLPGIVAPPLVVPEQKVAAPAKRNERPNGESKVPADVRNASAVKAPVTAYFYEFTRPGFSYSRIEIEHDDTGKGTILFLKDGFDETITDPIALSTVTLAKINAALAELKFLDSSEVYQHARDYSHMGNVTFRLKHDARERTAKYNWTENAAAKTLMDEYRRISNEYTWRFEISVARQNQPLLLPGLMDTLDSYMRRNEISDPSQMLPFLTELSNDERLPLMARNRAAKLISQINKRKEDKKSASADLKTIL